MWIYFKIYNDKACTLNILNLFKIGKFSIFSKYITAKQTSLKLLIVNRESCHLPLISIFKNMKFLNSFSKYIMGKQAS